MPNTINDETIINFLDHQENLPCLRFITCGSVDDGKSTLIGRLLYDSKTLFDDQIIGLKRESKKKSNNEEIDFSLLVDGLEAEREQGITIDVAYRFFATDKRRFIVADTPGHLSYTRNMATGASTADIAIILVDARKGLLPQTHRHSFIVSLMGIKRVILAVNKMDLVDFDEAQFLNISTAYQVLADRLGLEVQAIPLSAKCGDNVFDRSDHMNYYQGPTLMQVLETIEISNQNSVGPARFSVQWVNRPHQDFRGFSGTLEQGMLSVGDEIINSRTGFSSKISQIITPRGPDINARPHEAVTLTLDDEIDISRGDVLSPPTDRPKLSDQIQAHLIWMHQEELIAGRQYIMLLGTQSIICTITDIRHRIDVTTFEKLAAKTLELNDIGVVNLACLVPIQFDPYKDNQSLGGFLLLDRLTNKTLGAGMIDFGLRRADNIHIQALHVTKVSRSAAKNQRPRMIWLTGLSGSGKSTIANELERKLHSLGFHTSLLDGDNLRHGLNKDLGFTEADRVENIRRVAEVGRLMTEAGLIVIASFISPYRSDRAMARSLFDKGEFLEIHIATPLEVAISRDPKGLYAKAIKGQIKNFTGIDSPYEEPSNPDLRIDTTLHSPAEAVDLILKLL